MWERLKSEWKLEAREFFYRAALPTAAVRMIYRSARDLRLIVVDKTPASGSELTPQGQPSRVSSDPGLGAVAARETASRRSHQ